LRGKTISRRDESKVELPALIVAHIGVTHARLDRDNRRTAPNR
jgi:hypothetical protein